MKKAFLAALVAALPAFAQEGAPVPPPQPPACNCACSRMHHHGPRHEARRAEFEKKLLEKFDANKDGQLDEQEKEAMKAAHEARRAEFEKKLLEKFDANKDGQLDGQEKEAMKADFRKHHAERGCRGPKGGHAKGPRPMHPGCPGKEGAPAPCPAKAPACPADAPAPACPAEAPACPGNAPAEG